MADDQLLLELRGVDSGYGEIQVLKDIALRIRQGKIVSIIGANGAGKSTLLKTIFGIVRPTRGQILFDGRDVASLSTMETLRLGMSYVPEGRSNFPAMTVEENLEMGAYIRDDPREIRREIDALCERFPIVKEKRTTAVGNLSGGQQQMVEIAIALMLRPKLMLIDEPTLGLAPILTTEVFQVLQEINRSGTTIVLVEQNAKRALEISDYGFVLELGRIRFEGEPSVLADNEQVYRAYLGER